MARKHERQRSNHSGHHAEPRSAEVALAESEGRKQAETALRASEVRLATLNDELAVLKASLERRVGERTRRLEQQSSQLRRLAAELADTEQRERRRLAQILHDHLQQLLVAAKVRVALSRRRSRDPVLDDYLADVSRILEDAIEAARSLSAQLRPPILYEKGLEAAVRWLGGQMKEQHGLEVAIEVDGDVGALPDLAKSLVFEAVRELLLNVVKHARTGDAQVTMRAMACGRLHVCVADQGRGFDSTAVESAATSGFGLFTLRERLAALGGRTKVLSRPGAGTRIHISVPLQPSTSPRSVATSTAQPTRLIRVLLVDDHRIVRQGIATLLGEAGGIEVVDQAADGIEAVEKARRLRPDIVVMDINMPRMDGVEATRRICSEVDGVQVIGLSVRGEHGAAQSILEAGAATFLSKSGDPEQLIDAIARHAPQ